MSINWVRGFRRIGWVVTFPLAALIVLLLYGQTKEFAGYDRELIFSKYVTLPNGEAKFLPSPIIQNTKDQHRWIEVESASVDLIVKYLEEERKAQGLATSQSKISAVLNDLRAKKEFPDRREVEVFRINYIKFVGFIVGSIAGVALVIQGSISILAWIQRGFKV
jgi:hypothetical protein